MLNQLYVNFENETVDYSYTPGAELADAKMTEFADGRIRFDILTKCGCALKVFTTTDSYDNAETIAMP